MRTLYALLVGIDRYRAVHHLRGCVRDVRAARAHLEVTHAPDTRLAVRMLLDDEATRSVPASRGTAGTMCSCRSSASVIATTAPVPGLGWRHCGAAGQTWVLP